MKRRNSSGFTIIEVMIVLAIAGVIFIIIFLAVPALQRASRNQRRRADLARFYTLVEEYKSRRSVGRAAPFVTSTGTVDSVQFDDFKNNFLDKSFDVYQGNIRVADSNDPHEFTVPVDQIVYFPWHYCQDGSAPPDETVAGTSHDSYNYSVLIGMEDGFQICLDNGVDRSP